MGHGCEHALPCQFLMLVVGVGCKRVYGNASAWGEYAFDLYIARIHEPHEVVEYDVYAVLVEVAVVAEAEQVEFERFALHHALAWYVVDDYLREVGLSGDGAERCEFGASECHEILSVGMPVDKRFEQLGRVVGGILGGFRLSEQRKVVVVSVLIHVGDGWIVCVGLFIAAMR